MQSVVALTASAGVWKYRARSSPLFTVVPFAVAPSGAHLVGPAVVFCVPSVALSTLCLSFESFGAHLAHHVGAAEVVKALMVVSGHYKIAGVRSQG